MPLRPHRLFLTSYQKSGTHQIMPALGISKDIVDRSWIDFTKIPKRYGTQRRRNEEGIKETCQALIEFKERAFGHLPYVPEYIDALQSQPTKILFNVRDPRDIVVANLYSINKIYHRTDPPGGKGNGHLNLMDYIENKLLIEKDDPIADLIQVESCRWKEWLGWLNHDCVFKIKYEDLRTDGVKTLEKVASFVSPYSLNAEEIFGRLSPRHSNPTFRAGRIGDWKEEFQPHHKKLAEELLGGIIQKLGYEI